MRISWLLSVVAFLFSVIACLASAQDETYLYHKCSGANYTSNSIYQKNLNTLLSSLSSHHDINYGLYNFSEGEGIEIVNSIALCRGDVRQTACQRCVNFSTTDLPKRCPTQKEAIVWYDNCMFRYSNQSIFRTSEQPALYMWNVNNVSDVNKFSQSLEGLLSNLQKEASSGDSRQKFAIGDTNYANYTRIYGLVQCTPDLNEVQCSNCLGRSFTDITNAFNGQQGGRVIGPSCSFRYEIDQFYEIPPAPPPPATATPPPTTTGIFPPTGGGGNKTRTITIGGGGNKTRTIIIVVVSIVCFLMLIICMFFLFSIRIHYIFTRIA